MNRTKFKLTAIILSTVIFISIFFVGWNNQNLNETHITMYPAFKSAVDEEFTFTEEIIQSFNNWNKNIFLRLDIKFILLCITGFGDYNSVKLNKLINKTLEFYFYSVLIVFFINKKDGKKENMFISCQN